MKNLLTIVAILMISGRVTQAALITPTGYAADSMNGQAPVNLVNNSGLSTPISATSTHNNDIYSMWTANATNAWAGFDLGANYDLSTAYIWNHNWSTDNRAMKDFKLFVSTTQAGSGFVQVGGIQTLTDWRGAGEPANNVPLVYSGVRRVMIQGINTQASPTYTGLAEVKFEGTLSASQNLFGRTITPTAVTGPAGDLGSLAALINGAGFTAALENFNFFHDANMANMWRAAGNSGQTLTFDLGSTVLDVGGAAIWNYNRTGFLGPGVKDFNVYVSTTGTGGAFSFLTSLTLAQSDGHGLASYLNFPVGTRANAIRFEILSNYGGDGSPHTGLSEVRFFDATATATATPEPSTLLLIGCGGLLLWRARRRRV